ncbi:transposase [Cyanobium sp. Alchichica 3B3-8F6]|nr:transposase [Cyanobium sp. Alchichica 3B3-8F6]
MEPPAHHPAVGIHIQILKTRSGSFQTLILKFRLVDRALYVVVLGIYFVGDFTRIVDDLVPVLDSQRRITKS